VEGESLSTPPLVVSWSWACVVVLLACVVPVGSNEIQ
jgi:hypothetical protein